jgi:hypothetical protein
MACDSSRNVVMRSIAALGALLVISPFGAVSRVSAAVLDTRSPRIEAQLQDSTHPEAYASIISTDIDTDGDIDVVAVDHTLHLFVWVNDGSGHLIRQTPRPAQRRYRDIGVPAVDDQGAQDQVWVLDSMPWLNLDVEPPQFCLVIFSSIPVIPPSTLAYRTVPWYGSRAPPQRPSFSLSLS